MLESVFIEFVELRIRPAFGHQAVEPVYVLTHVKNGRRNKYEVVCEITGIQEADITLRPKSASLNRSETNQETLIEEAVLDLFEEHAG